MILFGLQKTVTLSSSSKHYTENGGIPHDLLPPIDHREEVSGCWSARLVCGVWRDCRRIHHCSYGRVHIQSSCQASQDRECGDDEGSLEGVSALDPCQPRSRGSSSRRSTQQHLQFPRRGVAELIHSAHRWSIMPLSC